VSLVYSRLTFSLRHYLYSQRHKRPNDGPRRRWHDENYIFFHPPIRIALRRPSARAFAATIVCADGIAPAQQQHHEPPPHRYDHHDHHVPRRSPTDRWDGYNMARRKPMRENHRYPCDMAAQYGKPHGSAAVPAGPTQKCGWSTWTCAAEEAASRGNLENAHLWARENGCAWNSTTCEFAAASALQWARQHGGPSSPWTCLYVVWFDQG
jgi:hypothetical protein